MCYIAEFLCLMNAKDGHLIGRCICTRVFDEYEVWT